MKKDKFIDFNTEKNDEVCLDIDPKEFRINDSDAIKIIKKVSKSDNATEFQELPQEKRDKFIKRLKENGLSIRQISRLTGISRSIVEKIH